MSSSERLRCDIVDQETRVVEMHRPDGKADILQQIEHGLLSIIGGYESLGRLYRGMICPTLRQYVHLGDASTMTDNIIYDGTGRIPSCTGLSLRMTGGCLRREPRERAVCRTDPGRGRQGDLGSEPCPVREIPEDRGGALPEEPVTSGG
jgi:hypothetical protein